MKPWRIQYFGKFEIWTPSGEPSRTPTIKAKAVIALLAMHRKYGMSRVELGNALWPDASPNKRRDSVKQAISAARKLIGETYLEAQVLNCRLTDDFSVETDLDANLSGPFMPGFEGEWFECVRRQFDDAPSVEIESRSAFSGFESLLKWYAANDPEQMYELMRADVYLMLTFGATFLADLLGTVEAQKPVLKRLQGWDCYWKGYALLSRDLERALSLFRMAANIGRERDDRLLASESVIWAGYTNLLLGRDKEARRLADLGTQMAASMHDKVLEARMRNLSGTADLHLGRTKEAVAQLLSTNDAFMGNRLEWAQHVALCGLYYACDCKGDEAERLLAAPKQVAVETGLLRLNLICDLADAHINLCSGKYADAALKFEQVQTLAEGAEAAHFEVYALEGHAVADWLGRDKDTSLAHLNAARRLRAKTKMSYTRWDRSRLRVP